LFDLGEAPSFAYGSRLLLKSKVTKEQIISLYKQIFFGREDPFIFIPENFLDFALRMSLDRDALNLSEILTSLCQYRHESSFYSEVMRTDLYQSFWAQQHQKEIELHARNKLYLEALQLEARYNHLKQENEVLSALIKENQEPRGKGLCYVALTIDSEGKGAK
jgi:hypothetical protein